jgi:hypothetical protein
VADGTDIDVACEAFGRDGAVIHGRTMATGRRKIKREDRASLPRADQSGRRGADATASLPATLPNTKARSTETAFGAVA